MQVRNYRYTEFGNTLKKTIFPQDSPKIYIGENPYSSNEFGKILDFLTTDHIRDNSF